MKIVMLGHGGAGKTTYVSLMYSEMIDGIEGFTLRAADAQHRVLMADAAAIRRGRYPNATHRRTSFDLVLHHRRAPIFPFEWRDYRGGSLTDRRSTSADAAALHADLADADGVLVLVDATKLLSDPAAGRDIRRLTYLVQTALQARDAALTPLVVGVTKCDLVDLDGTGVVDALLAPFEPLMTAVGGSEHVHGTILPLACGPEPVNVVLPVLWSLHFGLVGHAMRLHAEVESAQHGAAFAAANDTVGDRVRSWWRGEPSWAWIGDQANQNALDRWRLLEPLLDPAERLGALLDGVHSF